MAHGTDICVEVVYARPESQQLLTVVVPAGCTAIEAIRLSGLIEQFPGQNLPHAPLGIFGRRVPPSTVLKAGDRVEIYRPLIASPKAARRRRAARQVT